MESLRVWAVAAAGVLLLICPTHAADKEKASPPNIILIMSDDMGYSDIGCYGSRVETPVLDGLAKDGLRFTQFYNTARCCPTRAALQTGLYMHQAGVGHMMNDRGQDGYRGDLNKRCVTIAEALKPAGYSTYMAGKWHVTKETKPDGPKFNWPLQRGYDRFYGTIHGAGSFYDPNSLTRDNTQISPYADPEYKPETFYYTDAINDHAVRYIAEHKERSGDKPFFIYVAHTAAHWPMHALPEDIAKYKGKFDDGYQAERERRYKRMKELGVIEDHWKLSPADESWENFPDENREWEIRQMEVYAAMIDRMDQGIGRIVAELKKQGMFDNTLIFFLQDNGGCAEGMGRRGTAKRADKPTLPPMDPKALQPSMIPKQTRDGWPVLMGTNVMPGPADTYHGYGRGWANTSNTPFREYKHWVHEGGISTPLIAHWPAGIKRENELEHQPSHLIDIMATCVDVGGAEYPKKVGENEIQPMEGVSLRPAFEGKDLGRKGALYWEHEGNRAVRLGKWKLVAKGRSGPWELYDIDADRSELNNLAEKQPERVKEMADMWTAWAERANVLPWPGSGRKKPKLSTKTKFNLKPGAKLPQAKAPNVAKKPFHITATVTDASDANGVIVAHGGTSLGYVVYVRDGKLEMATRHSGKQTIVTADEKLPKGEVTIDADLAKDGKITLKVNGNEVAAGKCPGPLNQIPADGLEVGRDDVAAVGDYKGPNAFTGKIKKVVIELGK